jgi:endoglucanase
MARLRCGGRLNTSLAEAAGLGILGGMNGIARLPLSGPALLLATILILPAPACHAQPGTNDIFAQNRKLGRGVNILGYDPIWRSRDQARFQAKHFRLLKEAGFDSVRINLQPFRQMNPAKDYALSQSWYEVLDWAVREAQAQKLRVILDLHEYTTLGDDPATNKVKFLAFWRQISAHCQAAPEGVLFEVLNEPNHKLTPALWNEYLAESLAIIREKNPTRAVIIGPASWNSIDHLSELELPAADRNLIVTVHYYTPMDFTHQGAAWAGRKDKLGVDWLGTEKELTVLNGDFDKAASWAKQHDRSLFLGEFGAYDKAPMESRARYVAGVARAAEQRGWSWAYWQFDSDFILYDIRRDAWIEPILHALIPAPGAKASLPSAGSTTTKPGE